jgi:hypothetical protein
MPMQACMVLQPALVDWKERSITAAINGGSRGQMRARRLRPQRTGMSRRLFDWLAASRGPARLNRSVRFYVDLGSTTAKPFRTAARKISFSPGYAITSSAALKGETGFRSRPSGLRQIVRAEGVCGALRLLAIRSLLNEFLKSVHRSVIALSRSTR